MSETETDYRDPKIVAPAGHVVLEPGTFRKQGDQWYSEHFQKWIPAVSFGDPISKYSRLTYIRKSELTL